MHLVVSKGGERAWYGAPARGVIHVGSAREDDVQVVAHNIATRHVQLVFRAPGRARVVVRKLYGVRFDGRAPRGEEELAPGRVLELGPFRLTLAADAPGGLEPIDLDLIPQLADEEARLVYADSLEERGRAAEAALVRGVAEVERAGLAARSAPAWRQHALPIAIEACDEEACPRSWQALEGAELERRSCATCKREVVLAGCLAAARERALAGLPVALDPAVRRWPNDLREPVRRRPAIVMGQPADAK